MLPDNFPFLKITIEILIYREWNQHNDSCLVYSLFLNFCINSFCLYAASSYKYCTWI